MTSCDQVKKWVTSYIDGDIDEHRARAVRGHARGCAECSVLLAQEQALVAVLRQVDSAEPPRSLWAGIQSQLAAQEQVDAQRSRLWLWWKNARDRVAVGALIGAAAAAAAVLWLSFSQVTPAPVEASAEPAQEQPAVIALATAEATETFAEQRRREIAAADAAYVAAIEQLKAEVGVNAAVGDEFERLELALGAARAQAAGSEDPAARDEVHRLYRQQLALLQDAALAGEWL